MIGIIGDGVVGETTRLTMFQDCDVKVHDIKYDTSINDISDCELIFICTPTNNYYDIDTLNEICLKLSNIAPQSEIVIRSTVPPGFFNKLQKNIKNTITYLPEFIRERYALKDSLNRKRIFYATSAEESKLREFNNFNSKLRRMEFSELELLKMMRNNYHAMKVVFANHYYDICKEHGVDYDKLLDLFNKCKNGQTYMDVNEDLRGYGGKCLPKDINFMIDCFGEDVSLFKAIKKDNSLWKETIRKDT
jgi:UDPglucose 6-dehydrogenase